MQAKFMLIRTSRITYLKLYGNLPIVVRSKNSSVLQVPCFYCLCDLVYMNIMNDGHG